MLGAYSALFIASVGFLGKIALDTRRQATSANSAVNGRPKDEPTMRALVEHIEADVTRLRDESFDRHRSVTRSVSLLTDAVSRTTVKVDRLSDAIAGANNRLDALEEEDG